MRKTFGYLLNFSMAFAITFTLLATEKSHANDHRRKKKDSDRIIKVIKKVVREVRHAEYPSGYGNHGGYDNHGGYGRLWCEDVNMYGKSARGGGCNMYGCYYPGGSCNMYGCNYAGGTCNMYGCTREAQKTKKACED